MICKLEGTAVPDPLLIHVMATREMNQVGEAFARWKLNEKAPLPEVGQKVSLERSSEGGQTLWQGVVVAYGVENDDEGGRVWVKALEPTAVLLDWSVNRFFSKTKFDQVITQLLKDSQIKHNGFPIKHKVTQWNLSESCLFQWMARWSHFLGVGFQWDSSQESLFFADLHESASSGSSGKSKDLGMDGFELYWKENLAHYVEQIQLMGSDSVSLEKGNTSSKIDTNDFYGKKKPPKGPQVKWHGSFPFDLSQYKESLTRWHRSANRESRTVSWSAFLEKKSEVTKLLTPLEVHYPNAHFGGLVLPYKVSHRFDDTGFELEQVDAHVLKYQEHIFRMG